MHFHIFGGRVRKIEGGIRNNQWILDDNLRANSIVELLYNGPWNMVRFLLSPQHISLPPNSLSYYGGVGFTTTYEGVSVKTTKIVEALMWQCFVEVLSGHSSLSECASSLQTKCNGIVESQVQHVEPLEEGVENERKMMWRREELNEFNIVELGEINILWIKWVTRVIF
ncbi:hypothetical protein MTR_1g015270 [Medicago truncatula]|uniref:Uncharacterized protein n=1 Tax=Medicago truncatula TaxID=3880 RepID=G7I901_MEDTR|nr:hypothetical protein MTR_1g015270 [Medicago truncatula]